MSGHQRPALAVGNMQVPSDRELEWLDRSELHDKILKHWHEQPLPDWKTQGKTKAPRALMARFLLGQDLEAANAYLQAAEPWGEVGSTWFNHTNGDYDFTLAGLIPILYLFGEDDSVLYPETHKHLLKILLTEEGGEPLVMVPNTMGLVHDTENHLLMTEGSRYLKNRWRSLHGNTESLYDNATNGLETWLLSYLNKLHDAGLYEFNSIPYLGYTLTALLNLEAFGSEVIQTAAREVLDQLNWQYAVGSLNYRHFPPFRRQYRHAGDTKLDADYHTALIKSWMSLCPRAPEDLSVKGGGLHHALWGCWAPYRLPDQTTEWLLEKPEEYFVRLGHGAGSSPEIYSGGPNFLLTVGGVHRGMRSLIVARPITLMLNDDAVDLSEVIHLAGPGNDYKKWNNTGVWQNLAVAAGSVHIPKGWMPDAEDKLWSVYLYEVKLCIAVHSRPKLGIVYVSQTNDAEALLQLMTEANGDEQKLLHTVKLPEGDSITYDVNAPQDQWVIKQVDGDPVDRSFDDWARMIRE